MQTPRLAFLLVGLVERRYLLLEGLRHRVLLSTVATRNRYPIGVRCAKGQPKWMFVRSALVLTGIGVGIGMVLAAGLTQFMKSLLFGISPLDPFTYVAIPFILLTSAVLASYLPARRAASVDPVESLRAE